MGLSMDDLNGNGLACGGTKCGRSIVGTQVTCVGVYENGTYMYNRQQMDTQGLHLTCKYHSHTPPHMSPECPLGNKV